MSKSLDKLDKHRPFIQLIQRSPDRGDGWRTVSAMLESTAEKCMSEYPEFYESRRVDGQLQVRMSERGATRSAKRRKTWRHI